MDRASDSGSEGWGFESLPVYQKRGCLMASSFLVHREERTRKDGPNKVRVKKCPVDTFLVRGRVHRRKTASHRDVGFLLFLFTECCWQVLETAGRWLICKRAPSGVPPISTPK